jgi:hypothetical protein
MRDEHIPDFALLIRATACYSLLRLLIFANTIVQRGTPWMEKTDSFDNLDLQAALKRR